MKVAYALIVLTMLIDSCPRKAVVKPEDKMVETIDTFFKLVDKGDNEKIKGLVVDNDRIDEEIEMIHKIRSNFSTPDRDQFIIKRGLFAEKYESTDISILFIDAKTSDKSILNGRIEFLFLDSEGPYKIASLFVDLNDLGIQNKLPDLVPTDSIKQK